MELPLNQILLGDCLELLKALPDDSVDSVVTDPPYGLGDKDPDAMDIFMYVLGATLDTGGDFMGRDWEIPSIQVWREVFRVLKPGGYVVSFGGTRTFDLISIGLRMAGFESRDTISREFPEVELPILQWVQSQGMPKSSDVQYLASVKSGLCLSPEPAPHAVIPSKLIPVHSDGERGSIVVGLAQIQPGGELVLLTGIGKAVASSVRMGMSLSTSQAETTLNTGSSWRGISGVLSEPTRTSITETEIEQTIGSKTWKSLVDLTTSASTTRSKRIRPSGCKCPALPVVTVSNGDVMSRNDIPMLIARDNATSSQSAVKALKGQGSSLKPAWEPILLFRKPFKGTLVDNALKHGTGGLNIDATRVRHASKADFEAHKAQVDAIKEKGGSRGKSWKNSSDLSGANEVKEGGRWPANCLLEHSALCQKLGTQEIAPHPQGPDRFQKTDGGGFSEAYGNQLASTEADVAPIWRCAEGCPVRELNEQSGDRPSTLTGRADPSSSHKHPGKEMNPNSAFLGERSHLSRVYADGGGAARFFTQFEADSSQGRWPSNVVLQHAEGCKRAGSKRVKGTHAAVAKGESIEGKTWRTRNKHTYGACDMDRPVMSHVGPDGLEEVDAWDCVEGCPVKALDHQGVETGSHAAGNKAPETNHVKGDTVYQSGFKPQRNNPDYHADEGGVSRFFSQFDGVPFKYVPKANRKEAGCGEFEVQHITVKPLKLIQWLVKLVTPRGVWACPDCKGHGNNNDMSGVQARVPPKATGRGGLLDQLPEQDSGAGRTDHSGETLPELRGAIHPSLQGREVLFQRVSGEGTGQANASLPGLREVVSASADSGSRARAVVLKGVRQGQSKKKARNSKEVPGVSADLCAELPGGGPPSSVLLEGLRSYPLGSAETGPEEHHEGRLRDAVLTRASDGHEGGHATGTSIGDGKSSPTIAQVVGSSPSHQRSENGQSCRESSGDAEGGSRRTAEASAQATGLPPLPGVDRGGRKCPRCGYGMIQRPGVVLDMYCGSGTTPHAAVLEGMNFIGMERDEASHAEATRRLEIVLSREEERRYDQELFEFAHGGEQGSI